MSAVLERMERQAVLLRQPAMDPDDVPPLGSRQTLVNWLNPHIDLDLLPPHIAASLKRSRELAGPFEPRGELTSYEAVLRSSITDGAALNTSVAEVAIANAYNIPGNYLQPGEVPGRTIRGRLRGRISNIVTTPGTITFRVRYGTVAAGVVVMASGAITMDALANTNAQWSMDFDIVVRTVGATGTVFGQGEVNLGNYAQDTIAKAQAAQVARFMGQAGSNTPATATIDMTTTTALNVSAQFSISNANNGITVHQYILESLN